MIKESFTMEVMRPLEEVFAYVSDFRNNPKWQDGLEETKQSPDGPTAVGTKVTEVRMFLGQRMESVLDVTEFEPNKRLSFKSVGGPIQFKSVQTFESIPGGTRSTMVFEAEPGGFFKLAEPMVASGMRKNIADSTAKLKATLEAKT